VETKAVPDEPRKDMKVDVEDLLTGDLSIGEIQIDALALDHAGPKRLHHTLSHSKHLSPGVGVDCLARFGNDWPLISLP